MVCILHHEIFLFFFFCNCRSENFQLVQRNPPNKISWLSYPVYKYMSKLGVEGKVLFPRGKLVLMLTVSSLIKIE